MSLDIGLNLCRHNTCYIVMLRVKYDCYHQTFACYFSVYTLCLTFLNCFERETDRMKETAPRNK